METKRYSLAVVSSLLLNGFERKDTKTSQCLFQPGEKNSQGLTPSSQVEVIFNAVFVFYDDTLYESIYIFS